ncbi:MAG TPA: tetratricopeptide repeat protein [Candidatus Binataceae bacterium]|nr:tetratricopeptide repeat protein [Candidatus Binataceae bacterium]
MPRRCSALSLITLAAATVLSISIALRPARADDANTAKARELVQAAIKMQDSNEAVKLLWQATDIDPTYADAYVYLGLYYNSRSDFANVVKVYQKLVKNQPNQVTGYLNIGEAYLSFQPPKNDDALTYFRKAYEVDPKNSFAALRMGEIYASTGNRDEAVKYLRVALADSVKNPNVSAEAEKTLKQIGAL